MTFHDQFADFSQWLWIEFANHLWQSTLFFLLIMGSIILLTRANAKARYFVWLIGSLKFALPLSMFAVMGQWLNIRNVFPHIPTVESAAYSGISLITAASPESIDGRTVSEIAAATGHSEIYCVLTLLWLGGCLFLFTLWWKRSRDFRASLTCGNISTVEREIDLLKRAQTRLGFTSPIKLINSDSILEPIVWGIRKPIIVIPSGLSQKLTDEEFELILIHELSHVARRDNLIGILQMALCCLLWFHPLVWFIRRKLIEERERACDEAVVPHESKPRIYAVSLLKVVRFGLHSQESPGSAHATGADLRKRLELIMRNKFKNTNSGWQWWIVSTMVAALVFACLVSSFATTQTNDRSSEDNQDKDNFIRSIQTSGDVSYAIDENDDSPLKIVEVISKEIPRIISVNGKKAPETTPVYSDLRIKVVNVSNKTITGFLVAVKSKAKSKILRGVLSGSLIKGVPKLSIAPEQTHMIKTYASEPDFYVTVIKVQFDNGSIWTPKETK
jgi:beta-lactamase regulating signal transducer with metallopeptidase domain